MVLFVYTCALMMTHEYMLLSINIAENGDIAMSTYLVLIFVPNKRKGVNVDWDAGRLIPSFFFHHLLKALWAKACVHT